MKNWMSAIWNYSSVKGISIFFILMTPLLFTITVYTDYEFVNNFIFFLIWAILGIVSIHVLIWFISSFIPYIEKVTKLKELLDKENDNE